MVGWPGGSAYCASKAALNGFVRVMAVELARKKIRANAVCPGYIKTELLDGIENETGKTEADYAAAQPLGLGEPGDVAQVVAFLLSDASRFVTGTSLLVDGGYFVKGN